MTFRNKTILITGGTGSFGTKFTEILLKKYHPKAIRVFSNEEFPQWQMEKKFSDKRLRFLIGGPSFQTKSIYKWLEDYYKKYLTKTRKSDTLILIATPKR